MTYVAVSMWISISGPEPEGLDHLESQEELPEGGLCAGREEPRLQAEEEVPRAS